MSYDHCALWYCVSDRRHVNVSERFPKGKSRLTLDSNVNVVLRLLCLARILIGLGEGVCEAELAGYVDKQKRTAEKVGGEAGSRPCHGDSY